MSCNDPDSLSTFEEENDKRTYFGGLPKMLVIVLGVAMFAHVLLIKVSLIGTQKSQTSEFTSESELTFGIRDIENLVEMKFFANMTTESV